MQKGLNFNDFFTSCDFFEFFKFVNSGVKRFFYDFSAFIADLSRKTINHVE